ncbi:MAG: hypothetical protein AAGA23_14360 [Pseudomonadota bacterium]
MSQRVLQRPAALIAAVLGGQTLAMGLMLATAYALSDKSDASVATAPDAECVDVVPETAAVRLKPSQLLNLSVGWR